MGLGVSSAYTCHISMTSSPRACILMHASHSLPNTRQAAVHALIRASHTGIKLIMRSSCVRGCKQQERLCKRVRKEVPHAKARQARPQSLAWRRRC